MREPVSNETLQLGIVVRDLEATMRRYVDDYGIGPWEARPCFAALLGGPDRRTLFRFTADWHGTQAVEDVIKAQTGQVLVAAAPAPGVGWP